MGFFETKQRVEESVFIRIIANVLACIGIFVFIGCGSKGEPMNESVEAVFDSIQPDQITSNAHIYLYKAGRKTTDLTADEIRQFTKLDSSIATNLYVLFFDSTGERVSTLIARNGYIREKDNFLAVSDSVVLIGEDSVKLITEYLEWDSEKDSIMTDSFVTIIRNNSDTLTSYGMQSDPTLKNISFKKASGKLTDIEKVKKDAN
ncbi:MAG: LPS export ABC transporter periplasmic protein LptC [candidate division Zixibacteria bacterium]|nr:LPS export ABC transporter periplasmic protein LptC [candidate division Zixibacteria bacterium]